MATMTAIKLDGNLYRDEIFADLATRVQALQEKGITPGLATVLVGDDPASHAYVKMKHRDCEQVGVKSIRKDLPADISQEELHAVIDELNADPACTGYIVQLPLPKHLNENAVLERIDPAKDADGLHPVNLGKLVLNEPAPLPCTPNGAIHLLKRYGVETAGKKVVVIGRGVTVGRPIGLMLTRKTENATVTLCHTGTQDLKAETIAADIIHFTEIDHRKYKTLYSIMSHGTLSISNNTPFGQITGASANGRKAWLPLSDGISPTQGADYKGPTAIIKSISKLNNDDMNIGMVHNFKIMGGLLDTPEGEAGIIALLRAACLFGNGEMQFNYLDNETLIDAQQHPDEHRDLIVRVAGYSAFFTELCKDVQDEIISRTMLTRI